MRYLALLGSISGCLSGLTWSLATLAAPPPITTLPLPVDQVSQALPQQDDAFWSEAAELVQQQMYWANEAEVVLSNPDPNAVRVVRGNLLANIVTVERFLDRQYPEADLLCSPIRSSNGFETSDPGTLAEFQAQRAANIGLSPAAIATYCQLRSTTQRLETVVPTLERRMVMLSDVAELQPILLPAQASITERQRLSQPASASASAPNLPVTNRVLDQPEKGAIAEHQAPIQPAVGPPPQTLTTLQAVKQQLRNIQAGFPAAFTFADPEVGDRIDERNTYELHPRETELYGDWMAEPGQGMARILLAEAYHPPTDEIWNRAEPPVTEQYPFSPLMLIPEAMTADEFVPRLTLQVQDNELQVVPALLDYGFIADLGPVPLESLTFESPELPGLFRTYQPPTELAVLQSDQRQFAAGKLELLSSQTLIRSQVPVILNHTYVARLIQFDSPDFLLSDRPPSSEERARLMELLAITGGDVLVAFRPVNRRPDGSYTLVWKVLAEFPDPTIEDLDEYVQVAP